jgi:hypothetical protein
MKCLRIFATPDGESHFGEVDIATTLTPFSQTKRLSNFPLTTKPHEFVLFIFPQGCAKRAFMLRRIDSLPFGWMARSSLKRATER